jgi:hypothetical protein
MDERSPSGRARNRSAACQWPSPRSSSCRGSRARNHVSGCRRFDRAPGSSRTRHKRAICHRGVLHLDMEGGFAFAAAQRQRPRLLLERGRLIPTRRLHVCPSYASLDRCPTIGASTTAAVASGGGASRAHNMTASSVCWLPLRVHARKPRHACTGGPVRSEGPSMCTVTEVTLHDHAQHCPCMLDRSAVKVAALSALVPTVEAEEKAIATAITLQLSLSP